MPSRCPGVAELPALARIEGGNGSAGHFYHENSKGTGEHHKADKITEGHRVYSHFAKLQELWKITQVQTIHIPKSMTDAPFLKHPELTSGQKRYLYSIAKICDSGYLRTLMKRQYMHVLHQGSQKPGRLKIGYASKTRCKSLKTFRRQGRLLLLPVSLDDSQPCMNEETKEEELLNECMQSMSIQEPRTSQVNMTVSIPTSVIS